MSKPTHILLTIEQWDKLSFGDPAQFFELDRTAPKICLTREHITEMAKKHVQAGLYSNSVAAAVAACYFIMGYEQMEIDLTQEKK